jgi:hypothetical protein
MHGGGPTMILPEGAESTLTENAASPFLAEPAHGDLVFACIVTDANRERPVCPRVCPELPPAIVIPSEVESLQIIYYRA